MFTRFLLAVVWPGLLWSGLGLDGHWDRSAAEAISERRPDMAIDRNVSNAPEPTTPAPTPPMPAATPPPPAASPPPTPRATPPPTATQLPAATPPTQEPTSPSPKTRLITVRIRDLPDPAKQADEWGNRFRDKYHPNAILELAESIRDFGLLEPLQVIRHADGRIEIVCGHRRAAASTCSWPVVCQATAWTRRSRAPK